MSIILEKYKNKRRLGKGAYGDVLLVEDPNGKQFAIKMISKKSIRKDPYLEEYLEGEKQCMMSVKSQYIMELVNVEQDENYIYFICQYCDGGDLLNYQAKQQKKVFTMKMATKILSEVILGLQLLHEMDYLHRDIKPQNILLKKIGNQKYQFKLADFGFAKKSQDVGGTVLGTQHYMSPEIYSNDVYGFQVDMWAFGVLMYFMLNMQFPFRHNPHLQIQQKREQLIKQATGFSYSETVKKSKKKITQNCIPEAEDLFKKIFTVDAQKRITFADIRQHPLFRQHFPNIDQKSKILYNPKKSTINRYDSFVIQKKSMIQPKNMIPVQQKPQQKAQQKKEQKPNENQTTATQQPENITPSYCLKRFKSTQQKELVEFQIQKINFLYQSVEELTLNLNFLDPAEILALRYNLLKYYVILLREYSYDLRTEVYEEKYPNYKWKQFFKTPEFKNMKKQLKDSIDQSEIKISQTYDQCRNSLTAVRQFNPKIELILQPEVSEKNFDGKFKQSYRTSTGGVYAKVRQRLSNGNRYAYLTLLLILCHIFNKLVTESQQQLQEVFKEFVTATKSNSKFIDFSELRSWLSTSQKSVIKNVIVVIVKRYLS